MLDLEQMAKLINKLSVFLPAYNEEGNIETTIKKTREVLAAVADTWELIIVNDGSTDRTEEIITKLASLDRRIVIVNHATNRGYGSSLRSGLYKSRYPWIAFIDSDGQFDFGEITKFIEKQKETGADLVIGYYKKREESFGRIFTSKVWELIVFLMFGLKVKDVDCAFKLISKKVIDKIPKLESQRGAFISSELLIKAKRLGYKITQVPVTRYSRLKGAGTGRNLNVIMQSFTDLFKLWRKLN